MVVTVNILDEYTEWLKSQNLTDTDVNFLMFMANASEPISHDFKGRTRNLEFRIIKEDKYVFFVECWVNTSKGYWFVENIQEFEFDFFEELILAIKQNNVVIWNKSED